MLGENAAQSFAAKEGPDIQAFHFAYAGRERPHGDATGELAFVFGEKQAPVRWRVVTRQASQFLIEILKTQAEAKGFGVFEEQFASQDDLLGRRCRNDDQPSHFDIIVGAAGMGKRTFIIWSYSARIREGH